MRTVVVIALVNLLLLAACGRGGGDAPEGEAPRDSRIDIAFQLMREGQIDAGFEQLAEVEAERAGDDAPRWLGEVVEILLSRRRIAEAESLLAPHADSWDGDPGLTYAVALFEESKGNLEAARTRYAAIPEDHSRSAEARGKLATIAFLQGRNAEAIEHAEAVLANDRFDRRARTVMARALLAEGRADEAYRQILQVPASPTRFLIEAEALLASNRPGEAIGVLRTLMQGGREAPAPKYLLGQALLQADQLEEAREVLSDLASMEIPYEESQLHLATVERRLGNPERADEILGEYRELRSWREAMALRNEGLEHSKLGELEEALEYFERAREKLPEDTDLANDVGAIFARMERFDDAKREFLSALERDSTSTVTHRNLANLYHILDDQAGRDRHMNAYLRLVVDRDRKKDGEE